MENNIPTAEEFIISKLGINGDVKLHQLNLELPTWILLIKEYSILKSKFHVEAALKVAAKIPPKGEQIDKYILNAYPLDQIK